MSLLLKDPLAMLDYAVDWGEQYLDDDYLVASDWSVSPADAGAPAVTSSQFEPLVARVVVSGGMAGNVYRLTNRITLASGRIDRRSVMLRVDAR